MKNLSVIVRRGGVPALAAGWLALGLWPLPQLAPRLVGHPLDLRTAIVTSLVWVTGIWWLMTMHGRER